MGSKEIFAKTLIFATIIPSVKCQKYIMVKTMTVILVCGKD